MSEVVVRERGPLARIGLMSGPEARAPNLTPYLLAAPLIAFMVAFYILPVVAMLMRSVSDPSWTLQHYAALPDDVVTDRSAFRWLGGESLAEAALFSHLHEEHEASIREWLRTRGPAPSPAPSLDSRP